MGKLTLISLITLLVAGVVIYTIALIRLTSDDRADYGELFNAYDQKIARRRAILRSREHEREDVPKRKTKLRFMSGFVQRTPPTTVPYELVLAEPDDLQTATSTLPTVTSRTAPSGGVTVVSALLDIGRGTWWYYRRPFEIYLDYLQQMLQLDVNMVLFVDKKAMEFARQCRTNVSSKTIFYETTLADVPLWRHHERMAEVIEEEQKNYRSDWDQAMRNHPEATSADYDLAVNSKSYFLFNVSSTNPFDSTSFVWLDAGYGHGTRAVFPADFRWSPTFPPGKMSLIKLTPPTDLLDQYSLEKLYRQDWSVISGGFIAGDKATVSAFHGIFEQYVVDLLRDRKVDDDQTILVLMSRAYPQMFNLVYGDWFDAFRLFP